MLLPHSSAGLPTDVVDRMAWVESEDVRLIGVEFGVGIEGRNLDEFLVAHHDILDGDRFASQRIDAFIAFDLIRRIGQKRARLCAAVGPDEPVLHPACDRTDLGRRCGVCDVTLCTAFARFEPGKFFTEVSGWRWMWWGARTIIDMWVAMTFVRMGRDFGR